MASYRSHEGKALSPASQLCGSCEMEMADRYCPECPSALCKNCERGHKKNRFTKDHKIINIGELVISQTGTQLKSLVKCKPHARDVHQVCVECMVLMCAECATEHKEHKTFDIQSDPKGLQDVCTEEIKQLLDLGIDLHSDKKVCEELIQKYEETYQMIQEKGKTLIDKIKECLDEFEQKTQNAKDKLKGMIDDKSSGLATLIDGSDQHVKRLTDLRRHEALGVLLDGVVQGIGLIESGKQMRQLFANENRTREIEQFMRDRTEANQLTADAIKYFEFPFTKRKLNVANMSSLSRKHKVTLPPTKGTHGWRFCRSLNSSDSVLLYNRGGRDILTIDLNSLSLTKHTAKTDLLVFACINSNPYQYVAIDDAIDDLQHNHLYLLDDAFQVTKSCKFSDEASWVLFGLTTVSKNEFIVTETTGKQHSKYTFTKVVNGEFIKLRSHKVTIGITIGLFLHPEKDLIINVDVNGACYYANVNDFAFSQFRKPQNKEDSRQTGYGVDYEGNFIIGCENGAIRICRDKPFLDKVVVNTGLKIQGLMMYGHQLFICDESNLYVYE